MGFNGKSLILVGIIIFIYTTNFTCVGSSGDKNKNKASKDKGKYIFIDV